MPDILTEYSRFRAEKARVTRFFCSINGISGESDALAESLTGHDPKLRFCLGKDSARVRSLAIEAWIE
jgi:hypothetical protein